MNRPTAVTPEAPGVRSDAGAHGRDSAEDRPREQLLCGLPLAERTVELGGVPTAVLEGGEGPPIVLLHGAGEFAATWLRVIPELTRTHRVVVPDLPGHGASSLADGPLDADRMFAWLTALIGRTCSAPPVVVGHLLGGAIAARFAADHGDRLRALVLVDALGLAWFRPTARFALAMVGFLARPTQRTRDRLFRRCFADLDDVRAQTGEHWEPLADYALDRARNPTMKVALRSLMPRLGLPAIPAEGLAGIDVPVTLIWGRHALQVRVGIAEAASARYGWPLHVIEDAADDPAVEQPETFVRALRAALQVA